MTIKRLKMKKELINQIKIDLSTATPREIYNLGVKMTRCSEYEYKDGIMYFYNYIFNDLLTFEDIDKYHKEVGEDFFETFNLNETVLQRFKGFLIAKFPEKSKEILDVEDVEYLLEIEGFKDNV